MTAFFKFVKIICKNTKYFIFSSLWKERKEKVFILIYVILTDIFTTTDEVKEPDLKTENNSSVILEKPSLVSVNYLLNKFVSFFPFHLPFILPF